LKIWYNCENCYILKIRCKKIKILKRVKGEEGGGGEEEEEEEICSS
jgi:hypothetical protein